MGNGFIERFREAAELYLQEGRVGEIEFSNSTYQIEVIDKTTELSVFAFLQFDADEMLSDAFCSCDAEEMCPHVAASFLRIYNGYSDPLHRRFENSFWNALCTLLADHFNYQSSLSDEKEGVFFAIKPLTKAASEKLQEMQKSKKSANPENSIKFSNVSQEEIQHWREGRASAHLRYELSFWSDFAKWLMLLQDANQEYSVDMQEGEDGFPTHLKVHFPEIEIEIQLQKEQLAHLIASLETLKSPLIVHRRTQEGISITYDEEKKRLEVHRPKLDQLPLGGKQIGEWIYVEEDGFYPLDYKYALPKDVFEESEIDSILSSHGDVIAKYLTSIKVHKNRLSIKYKMHFDRDWNLHIDTFLFEEGDLEKKRNAFFEKWAYIASKGFYPLTHLLFDRLEPRIEAAKIPSFIARNRHLLEHVKGFRCHLANIETALSYSVSEKKELCFFAKFSEDFSRVKEFGEWIYIEGEGFFAKKTALSLAPGIVVEAQNVSHFIKHNVDELEHIADFFLPSLPLTKRGVSVKMHTRNTVIIAPEYELEPAYEGCDVLFFDAYVYVVGKGFAELPQGLRLKERYEKSVVIHEKELFHFFEAEMPKLQPHILSLDPSIQAPHKCDLHIADLKKTQEGISGAFYYQTEIGKIDVNTLRNALQNKERYLFSEGGRIDLHDERFEWLGKARAFETTPLLTLSAIDFLKVDLSEGFYVEPQAPAITKQALEELRTLTTTDAPNTKGLKSDLRLYQKTGLEWLWFLYRNQLSGLLCDDMGLGKTHQAMALLAAVYNVVKSESTKSCRFLVVAPTSVIYHWQEKLKTFLPHFKVHFFHGLKRTLKRLPKDGVVLTSYGIMRSEQEALSKIDFEVAIFDELQVAKNPSSRTHSSALHIKANMRLGLSGTPIENNLRELKSLFDIVLPGYMPKDSEFRDRYIFAIEREGNSEKRAELTRLIKPFVLRRKKKDVLQELPEKTEDKISCDLSLEQQLLYQEALTRHKESLIAPLQEGTGAIPYIHIFSLLSSLKQICDHPALIKKTPQNYKNHTSGKWDLFVELLKEALESEQKVVVFTQYLYMLDIMEAHLKQIGVSFAQIRGGTQDRQEQMRKFQEDPNCLVFIGTLQAAGLGIDLTAASIVILYDRWWNAARENQAIDRVHRIGQKWGVQVYKLITKGTIEEKIDLLITHKGKLLEEVILTDDEAEIKRFTREELLDLLSYFPPKN